MQKLAAERTNQSSAGESFTVDGATVRQDLADNCPRRLSAFSFPRSKRPSCLRDHEISEHGRVCTDDCKDWEGSLEGNGYAALSSAPAGRAVRRG